MYTKIKPPTFKVMFKDKFDDTSFLTLNEYEVRQLQVDIHDKTKDYTQWRILDRDGKPSNFREDGKIIGDLDDSWSLNTDLCFKIL